MAPDEHVHHRAPVLASRRERRLEPAKDGVRRVTGRPQLGLQVINGGEHPPSGRAGGQPMMAAEADRTVPDQARSAADRRIRAASQLCWRARVRARIVRFGARGVAGRAIFTAAEAGLPRGERGRERTPL